MLHGFWRVEAARHGDARDAADATYHKLVALEAEVHALRLAFKARRGHLRATAMSAVTALPQGTVYRLVS